MYILVIIYGNRGKDIVASLCYLKSFSDVAYPLNIDCS